MVDFLSTNLNNILSYVGIFLVAVSQIIDIFRNKKNSSTLSLSLKEYVRRNTKEQNDTLNQTIEEFQATAFRQLADEIVALKDTVSSLKQMAKDSAESDKKIIADQRESIMALQEQLTETNQHIAQLQERINTEAETNQQRYIKLNKRKEA